MMSETDGAAARSTSTFVRAPGWLVLAVGTILLALLVWLEAAGLDRELFLRLNTAASENMAPWAHLTILSDGLVALVLLLPWIRTHPERIWAGLLGAVVMAALLAPFKLFVSLPRPEQVIDPDAITLVASEHTLRSFPSGHAATIFLYAGIWLLSVRRVAPLMAILLPATVIAVSRVAVGVHWPSDVLAGAAVGWIAAWIGLRWAYRLRHPMARVHRYLTASLFVAAAVLLVIDHTGYPGVVWLQRAVALTCLVWGAAALRSQPPSPLLAEPPDRVDGPAARGSPDADSGP